MSGTYPPNLGEIKVKIIFCSFNQILKPQRNTSVFLSNNVFSIREVAIDLVILHLLSLYIFWLISSKFKIL